MSAPAPQFWPMEVGDGLSRSDEGGQFCRLDDPGCLVGAPEAHPYDRACMAVDAYSGHLILEGLTVTQLAAVMRVSPGYVHKLLTALGMRRNRAKANGRQPVPPMASVAPAVAPVTLVDRGPQARLAQIVNEIGIEAVLDWLAANETKAAA
jgi:hypothetical protein